MSPARRFFAAALVFVTASGCQTFRGASDKGHRLLDRDGLPPQKFLALVGALPGYAVAIPVGLVMLPTYAFEHLQYPSGPDHDVEMPLVFAPFELGGGVGAWIFGAPVELALGSPSWRAEGQSPVPSPSGPPEGAAVPSPPGQEGAAVETEPPRSPAPGER